VGVRVRVRGGGNLRVSATRPPVTYPQSPPGLPNTTQQPGEQDLSLLHRLWACVVIMTHSRSLLHTRSRQIAKATPHRQRQTSSVLTADHPGSLTRRASCVSWVEHMAMACITSGIAVGTAGRGSTEASHGHTEAALARPTRHCAATSLPAERPPARDARGDNKGTTAAKASQAPRTQPRAARLPAWASAMSAARGVTAPRAGRAPNAWRAAPPRALLCSHSSPASCFTRDGPGTTSHPRFRGLSSRAT
jgi:hypothetical protein